MRNQHHELRSHQQEMTTTPATAAPARYPAGPSKDGRNGEASAPGVAEALGHQGAPDVGGKPVDTAAVTLPRAAEAAALRRVARRRRPDPNGQRKERVDARYSVDEKDDILRMARSLNIAGAHYVGAVVMAHVHGDLSLPGQRTPLDDYIDELTALRSEVAKIGHNINQIAKKLNSGGHPHPGDTAVLAQAERTLTAVGTTVRHIAAAANQAVANKAAR
ncbi:MobC family plasmid mobilization relaxosome protein [Streptomyces ipomoeae]|uniref:MobC family plasmid mobilization relaxosome protein n=1 Tax=Streptomyces ipomoeae TaxID=103232 RepID=UPI0015F029CB|nr:MobC family plasmid mobilization relaxosome protein [Streptomyces ipomoeae]MDX2822504.1 MobC family plasmid mobilization relaxosome protein [Streptomyces ipomoeae]MDX2875126.1 MobC family plasmid mobilization relaxosome protein [Streptomyces ipomoeae]